MIYQDFSGHQAALTRIFNFTRLPVQDSQWGDGKFGVKEAFRPLPPVPPTASDVVDIAPSLPAPEPVSQEAVSAGT